MEAVQKLTCTDFFDTDNAYNTFLYTPEIRVFKTVLNTVEAL